MRNFTLGLFGIVFCGFLLIAVIPDASAAAIKGDADLSGSLTYLDADLISQYAVGLRTLTDEQKQVADMSGDGQVTSYDAALLLQEIKGNGDVNGDGMIDQEDAQYINDVVVGKSSFSTNQQTVGDVSGDGTITSYDAALLVQWTSTIAVESRETSAVITWITPRNTDSRIEYGTTNALNFNARDAVKVANHRLSLDGLTAATTYSYRIRSQDSAGNTMVSEIKTFTTTAIVPKEELKPDLIVSSLAGQVRETTDSGGKRVPAVHIEYCVENIGTADVNHNNFYIKFINQSLGEVLVESQYAGGKSLVGQRYCGGWSRPGRLVDGKYTYQGFREGENAIEAEIDSRDQIDELNDFNNSLTKTITVTPTPPSTEKITVYSPAQGERWELGKAYTIRWSPPYVVSQESMQASLTLPYQSVTITVAPYYVCWDAVLPCAVPATTPYTITSAAPNSGSYQWKIPFDLPRAYLGTQRITVSLNDTDQHGTSAPFTIVAPLTPVNKPPVITGVSGPTALKVSEVGRWTVTAYDPDGTFLSYKVDWGDQSARSSPLGESAPSQSLAQEATFTHSYSAPGRYIVRFTVQDEKGASTESTLTVEVGSGVSTNGIPKLGSAAIPAEIVTGARVSFSFSAEDPDNDPLSWTVSWGDGSLASGSCPPPDSGTAFLPAHAWQKGGTYTVEVSVNDCRGGSAYTSFPIVVSSPTPVPIPLPKPDESRPVPTDEREGEIRALRERIRQLELKVSELEQQVVEAEKRLTRSVDRALTNRVAGNILLQVESKGEAWYVDPVTGQRYYLKDGNRAYTALQAFGLGITRQDLEKIPVGIEERAVDRDTDHDGLPDKLEEAIGTSSTSVDSDGDGYPDGFELKNGFNPSGMAKIMTDPSLVNRLDGRIVLDVANHGRAWYIHDGKRYYLKDGEQAYQIMRYLSLGITNDNIRKIEVGEFE